MERCRILVVFCIEDFFFYKLPQPFNNIKIRWIGWQKQQVHAQWFCDCFYFEVRRGGLVPCIIQNNCNRFIRELKKACIEIGRVLKQGGIGIISDYKHAKEYKNNFEKLGMQTELIPASYLTTFPPLPIFENKKELNDTNVKRDISSNKPPTLGVKK